MPEAAQAINKVVKSENTSRQLPCLSTYLNYMISTIQKTVSGAFPSWTSTKEPKLLKRPPTHPSSEPNAPATSSPAAPMPQKRASTLPHKVTKRPRGTKAADWLRKNFSTAEEENDPIEVRLVHIQHVSHLQI